MQNRRTYLDTHPTLIYTTMARMAIPNRTPTKEKTGPDLSQIYRPIRSQLIQVESILRQSTRSLTPFISPISDNIMAGGGKRIRPVLLLLSAHSCGYRGKRATVMAAAAELLHTATLLHDDVIDQSKHRRGRPSAHTIFGNEAAILVGDFILVQSGNLALRNNNLNVFRPLLEVALRLVEGELSQLAWRGEIPTVKRYISIITKKTALFFSAVCQVGGMIAQGSKSRVQALTDYGLNLGIAFQLIDDCLDYQSGSGETGKDWGKDLSEGKVTLPLLYALNHCPKKEQKELIQLLKNQSSAPSSPLPAQEIHHVGDLIEKSGGFDYARALAKKYTQKAKDKLKRPFPWNSRRILEALAEIALNRKN